MRSRPTPRAADVDLFDIPFEEEPTEEGSGAPGPARAEARHVYTVSELTGGIRALIENAFAEVWVEGEISNCKVWNTGHMYFTLKDGGAQIKAVMFRSAIRYLRFKPEDGLHVVARGRLGVYEPKGEYQIVCEHMEPHGLGALQLAFEQLKKKLQAEGLFQRERKRALPALPRRIGIVTSLDGAALRDILKVLKRRAPNASVLITANAGQRVSHASGVGLGVPASERVGGAGGAETPGK
jgi:exodeoxyribonuclease VII large subunit